MNEDRTFGIEIECHASIPEHRMAERLRTLFAENNIPHDVVVTGRYGHDVDQSNFTTWHIKPDGSVMALNQQMSHQFPYDMEVVSPILKGSEGLKAARVVCRALDDGFGNPVATASRTCGFHVHHGMAGESLDALRNVANAWLEDEKFFFYALPDSRLTNTYCAKWSSETNTPCPNEMDPLQWYITHIGGRRHSLNFRSYSSRTTFEWRMHSGTVEWPKVSSWILMTQRWVDLALKGCLAGQRRGTSSRIMGQRGSNERTFSDFIDSFKSTTFEVNQQSTTPNRPPDINADNSDAEYYVQQFIRSARSLVARESFKTKFVDPRASKQKVPKAHIKTGTIIKMLLADWASKDDIVNQLDMDFGRLPSGKQRKFVAGQLTNMKNPKWGYGFNIVKRGRKFRLLPLGDESPSSSWDTVSEAVEPEVLTGETEVINVDDLSEEQLTALTHFIDRCKLFEGRRSQENLGPFGVSESTEEQQGYIRTNDTVPAEFDDV